MNKLIIDGEEWLNFAVSDTGIGIAEDKIDHVFEEFSQADNSTTRDYGGTGLGLAISRRFCQLLGGDLSVHSELGQGSTFTIRVPAVLPGTRVQQSSTSTVPASSEKPAVELDVDKVEDDGTILVIDDDPEASEIIRRLLVKEGFNAVVAHSGEQGLQLAHEIKPVAITLDVMMPGMDGWAVLRALKATPDLRTIPVIMLSMIDDRSRGYSLGAVDYLTKPVDREALHKAISHYHHPDHACSVLLIEDDDETRDVMARMLKKMGCEVTEAGDGQQALNIISDAQPRLILLDLMMPVMDGFEFLSVIREQPEWQHVPVIVVTAKDLSKQDCKRLNGMVEEVLQKKAYTRKELLERVREVVAVSGLA